MGIQLNESEAWDFLAAGHTGILTTLRRDGTPVSLPTWYLAIDRRIYLNTPGRSKKMARIRHDSRANFLVEAGEQWVSLQAVMLYGKVASVEDPAEEERIRPLLTEKYRDYRPPTTRTPKATQQHYSGMTLLRFDPEPDYISWDNAKLRLQPEQDS